MSETRSLTSDESVERLLRDAYRAVPVPDPDLEGPVLRRLRRERADAPARTGAPARALPATVGSASRWLLRGYWLGAAVVSVALIVRTGAVAPSGATLLLAAAAAIPLLVGARLVSRATGRSVARLVAASL